jgi:SAM-dependent methyltransferase
MASELPYPDASFDRVLSSLMIHHLKTPDKEKMAREIFRVLRPSGELHVLDFGKPRTFYGRLIARILHGFEETGDNFAGPSRSLKRVAERGKPAITRPSRLFLRAKNPAEENGAMDKLEASLQIDRPADIFLPQRPRKSSKFVPGMLGSGRL